MQKELRNRELKDEHDVLWEELENQLQQIREAYKSGKLMLNSVVVQKSALYLHLDRYVEAVKDRRHDSDEIDAKRVRRLRPPKSDMKNKLRISANNLQIPDEFLFTTNRSRPISTTDQKILDEYKDEDMDGSEININVDITKDIMPEESKHRSLYNYPYSNRPLEESKM